MHRSGDRRPRRAAFGIAALAAGVYLTSIAAGPAFAQVGALDGVTDTVSQTTSGVTQTTSGVTNTVSQTTSGVTDTVSQTTGQVSDTTDQVSQTVPTVSTGGSAPASSVTVGAGGGTVTTSTGGSFQAPPGTTYVIDGRTYTVPASGIATVPPGATFALPAQGGTVTATAAPGFAPASGRFFLVGAAPPPAGTPNLLVPFPSVLLEGSYTPRGVQVQRLRIRAKGALVQVSCLRRCPRGMRAQAVQTRGMRALRFTRFQRRYRAGAMLRIRVMAQGKIGKYVRFTVKRRKPPSRLDLCTNGLARRPIRCPR